MTKRSDDSERGFTLEDPPRRGLRGRPRTPVERRGPKGSRS